MRCISCVDLETLNLTHDRTFSLTGFVNTLLSWKAFIPLGRLTYCFYLIHLNYIQFYYAHLRKPQYYEEYDYVHKYLGMVLTVTLLSFVLAVTVEAPFLNLEKLVFGPLNVKKAPATSKAVETVKAAGQVNVAFVKSDD